MNPHDLALLVMVVGTGAGTLLMADAAEEASRRSRQANSRRTLFQRSSNRVSLWERPMVLQCGSAVFLVTMALCGALLIIAPSR